MVFESLPSLWQIVFTLTTFYALKFAYSWYSSTKSSSNEVKLKKMDWKKDVVYLYQFPKTPYLPNLSPFCLKVETFLRVFNIKHEVIPTSGSSKKGLKPFIELNGEHIADSQLIILHLQKYFNIQEDNLTEEQKAIERAFDRLLDGSFVYSSNLLKMQDHWEEYAGLCLDMLQFSPTIVGFAKKLFAPFLKMKVIERFTAEGTARHSTDEIISMMRNDLKAIQTYLGDKEFFFGDKPSMIDAAIFGHVAAVYFVSYSHIVKDIIIAEFPIVLKYVKRMGKKYYSDFKFEN